MNKKSVLTFFLIFLIILLISFPNLCLKAAQDGLLLWFNKVLPSLLPFMIFINLLIPLDGLKGLTQMTGILTKRIWHLPGYSFFAFFMGLIASYPMGAKTVKNLYESQKLSYEDAQITLCFSNNCGPLFIVATVGSAMFGHTSLGYFLLLIHILSALILSLFVTRRYHCSQSADLNDVPTAPPAFTSILNAGVMNAMNTILCVGGYIILFSVLIALLTQLPIVAALIHHFLPNQLAAGYLTGILGGIFELSNGSYMLSQLSPVSVYTIALASSSIGFGGLCVYFQTLYVLADTLPTALYMTSKIAQGMISFALTLLLYPFFAVYTQKTSLTFHGSWLLISLFLFIFSYSALQYSLHHQRKASSIQTNLSLS